MPKGRTPSINGYRTTRKPKTIVPDNTGLNNYIEKDPLNNYNVSPKVVDGRSANPVLNNNMGTNMSRNITDYAKAPVNSDLEYYNKLTNLRNNNNMLVEKYGLQGVRDQAVNNLAQQDVIRQQQQKALEEQNRISGIAGSGMADTLRSNVLSNYATNVKDIQNQYQTDINNAIDQQRLDKYNEIKSTILDLADTNKLGEYNIETLKKQINNSDLSEDNKNSLRMYLESMYSPVREETEAENEVNAENTKLVENNLNIKLPNELTDFISDDTNTENFVTVFNDAKSAVATINSMKEGKAKEKMYAQLKQMFIDKLTGEMSGIEKLKYVSSLEKLFDEQFKLEHIVAKEPNYVISPDEPTFYNGDVGAWAVSWDGREYNGHKLLVRTKQKRNNNITEAFYKQDGKWYKVKVENTNK